MRMSPAERANDPSHSYTFVAARPGTTMSQAAAEFDALGARLAKDRPSHGGVGVRLVPIRRTVGAHHSSGARGSGGKRRAAAAGGRRERVDAADRARLQPAAEFAMRAALGATRGRGCCRCRSPSRCCFAAIGALPGSCSAAGRFGLLIPLFAASLPPSLAIAIDPRATLFTALLALVIGTAVRRDWRISARRAAR